MVIFVSIMFNTSVRSCQSPFSFLRTIRAGQLAAAAQQPATKSLTLPHRRVPFRCYSGPVESAPDARPENQNLRSPLPPKSTRPKPDLNGALHSTKKYAARKPPPNSKASLSTKANLQKPPRKLEPWEIQKRALKKKFTDGWAPAKRLSPDAIEGVRSLHKQDPVKFSTPVLAEHFKISPEAIRRILKSKWTPTEKEMESKRVRWERREKRIWNHMAELGLRPKREEFADLSDVETLNKKPSKG